MAFRYLTLFLCVPVAAGLLAVDGNGKKDLITPVLDHSSDKKFSKDYPFDQRPSNKGQGKHAFDHPYPVVQDHEDYDKDFVKDENNDGGGWAAQMEYDTLRHQIRQKEKDVAQALRKKVQAEKNLHDAVTNERQAEGTSRDAEGAADDASKDAEDADDKLDKIESETDGSMGKATKEAKSETEQLKECKEELAKTRKELHDLIKEKKARDEKLTEKEKEVVKDLKKAKEEEKKDKEEVEVKEKVEIDYALKSVSKEKSEQQAALAEVQKMEGKVAQTEEEVKIAEAKVKALRRSPYVDQDGGVYRTDRNAGDDLRDRMRNLKNHAWRSAVAPLSALLLLTFLV